MVERRWKNRQRTQYVFNYAWTKYIYNNIFAITITIFFKQTNYRVNLIITHFRSSISYNQINPQNAQKSKNTPAKSVKKETRMNAASQSISYPPSIRAVFMKNKNYKLETRKIFIVLYTDSFVDNSSQKTNKFTINLILGKSISFMLK